MFGWWYNCVMTTQRTNMLAGFMSGLLILIILAFSILPATSVGHEIRTLYVEFDFLDSIHPSSGIKYESMTFRIGEKDPFVPLAKVETRVETRVATVEWPLIGTEIAQWESENRSVILKLVDGSDIEGSKQYWHFPTQNPNNTIPEEVGELTEEIRESLKDLPEAMLGKLNEHTDQMYGIGGSIDEVRRSELLDLTYSALRDGGYGWAADQIESRQGALIQESSSGVGGLVGYGFGSFAFAALWGVVTYRRLPKGEDQEKE